LPLLEEVLTLVIHDDEGREVNDIYLPDGFHAELRVLKDFDVFDVVLSEDGGGTTDGAKVEATVLLAGLGDNLAAVALSEGDETATSSHEGIDVGIHASGGSGAERTGRHALGSFGGTGIIDDVVSEVLGHRLASIKSLLNLGVGNVTTNDDGAGKGETGADRELRKLRSNFIHRLVQVNLNDLCRNVIILGLGEVLARISLQLF